MYIYLFSHPFTALPPEKCEKTLTFVNGDTRKLCVGDLIFEDDFTDFLNQTWNIDHFIPVNSKVKLVRHAYKLHCLNDYVEENFNNNFRFRKLTYIYLYDREWSKI